MEIIKPCWTDPDLKCKDCDFCKYLLRDGNFRVIGWICDLDGKRQINDRSA